jgi:hypothetical protein
MTESRGGSASRNVARTANHPQPHAATADLGDYRWNGYSLTQKQTWMRDGQGSAAVVPGMDFLNSLADTFNDSEDHLRATLAELGVHWSGSGASAACESLRGVLDWAGGLRITASGAGDGLGRYGDSFAEAKLQIPGLLEIDVQAAPTSDLAAVTGLQGDLRAGPAAASRADQAVNAALAAHERNTREVLAAFPDPKTQPAASPTPSGTTSSSAPTANSNTTPNSNDSDQQNPNDGHRHEDGAFGAMPIMPPMMGGGGGGYRTVPSRPGRLLDPANGPFGQPASADSADAGGVVPPQEPVATDGAVGAEGTDHAAERRAGAAGSRRSAEWTSAPHETGPLRSQRMHPFFNDAPAEGGEPLPPPVDRPLPPLGSTDWSNGTVRNGTIRNGTVENGTVDIGAIETEAGETGAGETGPGLPFAGLTGRLRRGMGRRSPTSRDPASEEPDEPADDDYVNRINDLDELRPEPEPASEPTADHDPTPEAEPATVSIRTSPAETSRAAGPLEPETAAIPIAATATPKNHPSPYPRRQAPQQPAAQQAAVHQPVAHQPAAQQPAAQQPAAQQAVVHQLAAQQPAAQPSSPQPAAQPSPAKPATRRFPTVPKQPSAAYPPQHLLPQHPSSAQAPITQAPITPTPVTPTPITQAPVTQAPVTPAPITAAPITATKSPYPPSHRPSSPEPSSRSSSRRRPDPQPRQPEPSQALQPTPEPPWSNGYPQQAEYSYPQPKYPAPRYSERPSAYNKTSYNNTAYNTGYDSEFDAEFDRELGMDFDERDGVPPVLGLPRTPVDPDKHEDRL